MADAKVFILIAIPTLSMNKLKPELKIAGRMLDLKTLDTNIVLNHLDEQIKLRDSADLFMIARNLDNAQEPRFLTLRELPVEKRLKRELMK